MSKRCGSCFGLRHEHWEDPYLGVIVFTELTDAVMQSGPKDRSLRSGRSPFTTRQGNHFAISMTAAIRNTVTAYVSQLFKPRLGAGLFLSPVSL